MTPYIFPGLKPPTGELFANIQLMIAENGGRLRLADMLESEMVYQVRNKYAPRRQKPKTTRTFWQQWEIQLILGGDKSTREISDIIGRSCRAICRMYSILRKTTTYKSPSHAKLFKMSKDYSEIMIGPGV